LDADSVCAFIRLAMSLSAAQGVAATRAVGKFGLAYALARMSENGVGARIDFESLRLARGGTMDGAALFEEHLYEAVIAVDTAAADAFEDAFASGVRSWKAQARPVLQKIGSTLAGRLEIGSAIDGEISRLQESYRQGWKRSFEGLN